MTGGAQLWLFFVVVVVVVNAVSQFSRIAFTATRTGFGVFKQISTVKNRDGGGFQALLKAANPVVPMDEIMATSPMVECGSRRTLRWPQMPAVDLLSEFPWIVAGGDAESWSGDQLETPNNTSGEEGRKKRLRNAPLLENESEQDGHRPSTRQPASPYKQRLLAAKPVRSPLSPAQRAGRKILQLKTELQQIVAPDTTALTSTPALLSGDALSWQHGTSPSRGNKQGDISQPRSSGKTIPASPFTSPSKIRAVSKQKRSRSPARKARGQTNSPTPAEQGLIENQERLAAWLMKNASRERGENQVYNTVSYSAEVDARVRAAVTCKDDESGRNDALWDDPVRSLLAAEVTSETVLGGFIPTRRLAFELPIKRSDSVSPEKKIAVCAAVIGRSAMESSSTGTTSPAASMPPCENSSASPLIEPSIVDFAAERASDIQQLARQQVAAGDFADALTTLDAGIHQILREYQDNHEQLRLAGFNYSAAAHQFASKLQLQYRSRHRERVRKLVLLQRAWRHFRRSALSRSTNDYNDAHAAAIQRPYKRRYRQIVHIRSAARIQKCFRVYQSQKHILHFHQACRLLLGRERHRRELERQVLLRKQRMWVRLKIVLRVLRLWKMRRYSITSLQKRWKGGQCRAQYVDMLSKLRDAESERRKREEAFVTERIEAITNLYRAFLRNTRRGRALVKLHAELPWLRFRRLRGKNGIGDWMELSTEERIDLLDRMYNGRQVGSWEWWVMSRELSLVDQEERQLQQQQQHCGRVTISSSGLQFLQHPPARSAAIIHTPEEIIHSSSNNSRVWTAKLASMKRQLVGQAARVQDKLSTAVIHASWRMVYYPMAYYWHHRVLTRRSRSRTRARLEEDFKRCAATFMRKQFRSSEGNQPRHECGACYEPFATTTDLTQHCRGATATGVACAAAQSRASLEWRAAQSDINSSRQRQRYRESVWRQILSRLPRQKQLPQLEAIEANSLHGTNPSLYRVQVRDAKTPSHWNFDGFKLTKRVVQRLERQTDRVSTQQLIDIAIGIAEIIGSTTPTEFNTTEVPSELVGYVFQTLGGLDLEEGERIDERSNDPSLMLLRSALYQLVAWNMPSECPSHIRFRAVADDRSHIGNDGTVDVHQLQAIVDGRHHRSVKALIAKEAKAMLDRCYHWFGRWQQRRSERQTAYHPGTTHGNSTSGADIGSMQKHQGLVTVFKRVGQHAEHGSAATTSPSTVVPITT